MIVHLEVRNTSRVKGCCRRDNLRRIAQRVCAGEGRAGEAELSLLLCDDAFITGLNRTYRGKNRATDVLSFAQEEGVAGPDAAVVLGDIVISLETVARFCGNDAAAMRDEVRLLFCHGLLHLLGHHHANPAQRRDMQEKQARYLGLDNDAAWRDRRGKG